MELSIIQIFKDWVIPIGSVGITIWFASSAKKDADKAEKLSKALDICMYSEKRISVTGRPDGATSAQFADYVMEKLG